MNHTSEKLGGAREGEVGRGGGGGQEKEWNGYKGNDMRSMGGGQRCKGQRERERERERERD